MTISHHAGAAPGVTATPTKALNAIVALMRSLKIDAASRSVIVMLAPCAVLAARSDRLRYFSGQSSATNFQLTK